MLGRIAIKRLRAFFLACLAVSAFIVSVNGIRSADGFFKVMVGVSILGFIFSHVGLSIIQKKLYLSAMSLAICYDSHRLLFVVSCSFLVLSGIAGGLGFILMP